MDFLELVRSTVERVKETNVLRDEVLRVMDEIFEITKRRIKVEHGVGASDVTTLFNGIFSGNYTTITAEEIDEIVEPGESWSERNEIVGLYADPELEIKTSSAYYDDDGDEPFLVSKYGLVAFLYNGRVYLVQEPVTNYEDMKERLVRVTGIKKKLEEFINSL